MNTPSPFMIFTSDTSNTSDDMNARMRELLERQLTLRKLDWRKVSGSYNGTRETAYLVQTPDSKAEHAVLVLAWRYAQESVLHVAPNGWASLMFLAGADGVPGEVSRTAGVGFWRQIDPATEGNTLPESYTVVHYGDNDAYFTTKALP